jgi:chromosome segregation ATPase
MTTTIETRVAVIERELSQITGLFDRLDTTIDKLSDVSNSIKQLLAVHETKLSQHEQTHRDVYDELERRRADTTAQHAAIQGQMTTMQQNFKKEIEDVEKKITTQITELSDKQTKMFEGISSRTKVIENWRWVIIGAGMVLFYIIQTTNAFGLLLPH